MSGSSCGKEMVYLLSGRRRSLVLVVDIGSVARVPIEQTSSFSRAGPR